MTFGAFIPKFLRLHLDSIHRSGSFSQSLSKKLVSRWAHVIHRSLKCIFENTRPGQPILELADKRPLHPWNAAGSGFPTKQSMTISSDDTSAQRLWRSKGPSPAKQSISSELSSKQSVRTYLYSGNTSPLLEHEPTLSF
jgi:hypothetical protein